MNIRGAAFLRVASPPNHVLGIDIGRVILIATAQKAPIARELGVGFLVVDLAVSQISRNDAGTAFTSHTPLSDTQNT
jgi:hypothetical protein